MTEDSLNQLTNTLFVRVAQVTKESIIGIIESVEDDHNMLVLRSALNRGNCDMLMSRMDVDGVHKAFEAAIF